MKVLALPFIALLLLVCTMPIAVAQDYESSLFIINRSHKDVQICREASKRRTGTPECRDAKPRERIYYDDIIKTGPEGRATVRSSRFIWDKDMEFINELGPNSKLSFGPEIDSADLPKPTLLEGMMRTLKAIKKFFSGSLHEKKEFMHQKYGDGGRGCILVGTDVILEYERETDHAQYFVNEGMIVCDTPDGQDAEVNAGQKIDIYGDRAALSEFPESEWDARLAQILGDAGGTCSPEQISGEYAAGWGPIKCDGDGSGLNCCYGWNCQWKLDLAVSDDGKKLEGIWAENDGRTGPVEFGLTEDCELSSGRFGYGAGKLTRGWSVKGKSQQKVDEPKKCESFCIEWVCGITGSGCSKLGNSCNGETRPGNICGKGCKQAC